MVETADPHFTLTVTYLLSQDVLLCTVMQKNELAPNVMAMVQSFNRLALLVPTEILEERTPQARSKVIVTFIQVRGSKVNLSPYFIPNCIL